MKKVITFLVLAVTIVSAEAQKNCIMEFNAPITENYSLLTNADCSGTKYLRILGSFKQVTWEMQNNSGLVSVTKDSCDVLGTLGQADIDFTDAVLVSITLDTKKYIINKKMPSAFDEYIASVDRVEQQGNSINVILNQDVDAERELRQLHRAGSSFEQSFTTPKMAILGGDTLRSSKGFLGYAFSFDINKVLSSRTNDQQQVMLKLFYPCSNTEQLVTINSNYEFSTSIEDLSSNVQSIIENGIVNQTLQVYNTAGQKVKTFYQGERFEKPISNQILIFRDQSGKTYKIF